MSKPKIIGISGYIGSGKDTIARIIQDYDAESNWQIKKYAGKLKEIIALLIGCSVEDLENTEFKNKPLGEEWNCYVRTSSWGAPDELLEDNEFNRNSIEAHKYKRNTTPRLLLQLLGTECGRNILHPNIWVNALFADYVEDTGYTYPMEFVSAATKRKLVLEDDDDIMVPGTRDQFEMKITGNPEPYNNGLPNWLITDVRFPNEVKAIEERGGIVVRVDRKEVNPKQSKYGDIYAHEYELALLKYPFKYVINNNNGIEELKKEVIEFYEKLKIPN